MNTTPNSNRIHIGIYGKRNAGKSSLLNAIVGQNISVVSSVKGTTTDPVSKAMELIPLGPVLFIDTAGLDDMGELGRLRVDKSLNTLQKIDFAIYVMDINDLDQQVYKNTIREFKKFNIPFITVINKIDKARGEELEKIKENYKNCMFVSSLEQNSILNLKDEIIKRIKKNQEEEKPLIGDLIPYGGKVILVVPVDSEAPKGRLILPQVQVIRDCLDHGIKTYIVRDTELESALLDIKDIDLVITDSQAFKRVNKIVPKNIKLTSFSIIFSRAKGDLKEFVKGVYAIENLKEGAKILMAESCTHSYSHEDIGRVKIPRAIQKNSGKTFKFYFRQGEDFSKNIAEYDFVIHCGACMVNRKIVDTRIKFCRENNVPITNYGIVLAYLNGILDRTLEIFKG